MRWPSRHPCLFVQETQGPFTPNNGLHLMSTYCVLCVWHLLPVAANQTRKQNAFVIGYLCKLG